MILLIGIEFNRRSTKNAFRLSCLFATATFVGCFKATPPWEITHPATGQVTYKGRSISEAELSFFPEDKSFPDSVRPKAKSTEDGKFVAWTHVQGDGVPAGSYKVTIVHNEVAVSKGTIVAKPNDLPVKYSRRDTTDIVVKIVAGKNDIPIELK